MGRLINEREIEEIQPSKVNASNGLLAPLESIGEIYNLAWASYEETCYAHQKKLFFDIERSLETRESIIRSFELDSS
ncbi:hypothetical protein ACLOJK_001247 [Asimina triloba]